VVRHWMCSWVIRKKVELSSLFQSRKPSLNVSMALIRKNSDKESEAAEVKARGDRERTTTKTRLG